MMKLQMVVHQLNKVIADFSPICYTVIWTDITVRTVDDEHETNHFERIRRTDLRAD